MINHLHETFIDMERRHIRDGEARIARQEEIVRGFDLRGSTEHALTARKLLVCFREIVALAKDRLAYIERKQNDGPRE